jgi:hypothetical protein
MNKIVDPLSQVLFAGGQNKKDLLRQSATLCAINYLNNQNDIEATLRREDLATEEHWQLVREPVLSGESRCMVFFNPSENVYSLTIRGPELEVSPSFAEDWFEKFKIDQVVDWPYPKVEGAQVSSTALEEVEGILKSEVDSQSLFDFIKDQVVPNNAELWVTGHGLGGGLAVLTSLAILQKVEETFGNIVIKVYPMTFGAPAVGNFVFASYFDSLFPYSLRVHNDLDIVPYTWGNLKGILDLYPGGPVCPEILTLGIDFVLEKLETKGANPYLQNNSQGVSLTGTKKEGMDFFEEMIEQHSINTYLNLLGVNSLS